MIRLFLRTSYCILLLSLAAAAQAAIGIYEWQASPTSSSPPVHITYRLNCPGSVSIDILNSSGDAVATIGPFDDAAGLCSHDWDAAGAAPGNYRARISASNPGIGASGTLVLLAGEPSGAPNVYGLAVDRNPESPGYGAIYVSEVSNGGRLRAYHADGSPKYGFGGDPESNAISLGFANYPANAPKGIGVDRLGNIYVGCSAGAGNAGIKVFDCLGFELYHVFTDEPQGNIFWLDGVASADRLEVYETGIDANHVLGRAVTGGAWSTVLDSGMSVPEPKQICFDVSGQACYVAMYRTSSDPLNPNPGVIRYVRQPDGGWAKDVSFDCRLTTIGSASLNAARYAVGVSCDSNDPDGAGPLTWSSLWMGLNCKNAQFGGNIVRKRFDNDQPMLFKGPDGTAARFMAADSVGNVAVDYGSNISGDLWKQWGLFAPGGEASSDTRLSGWFALAGSASAAVYSGLSELKDAPNGTAVELSEAKPVTAAFDGFFYIEESDRSAALRVNCGQSVEEGAMVRVGGTLDSDKGERVLRDAEILAP